MAESDLLELAARGRVTFHEPNEYVLWQGEPHRHQVFVIQQGTVSLWDESAAEARLRDVRGAGDLLGIERFNGAPVTPYSARSASDVLIYAFPASDFELLLMKYPGAGQFVAGYESVVADYEWADARREPQRAFLHDVITLAAPATCQAGSTVAEVAAQLVHAEAVALLEPGAGLRALLTTDVIVEWVANGAGTPHTTARELAARSPPLLALAPGATVTDAVLAMAAANTHVLAVTADGTSAGTLQAVVTAKDLSPVFGDQPVEILRAINQALSPDALRPLVQRARAFALQQLATSAAVEWIARFLHLTDAALVQRAIEWTGGGPAGACWCLSGAAGRTELMTRAAPRLVLVLPDDGSQEEGAAAYTQVTRLVDQSGYLERTDGDFEPQFHSATRAVAGPVRALDRRSNPLGNLPRAAILRPATLSRRPFPVAVALRCGGRKRRTRLRPYPGQRLPRQLPSAHILPRRHRRRGGRGEPRLPPRTQCAAATGGCRPGIRARRQARRGDLDARTICLGQQRAPRVPPRLPRSR